MDKKTKTMCVEILSAIVGLCGGRRRIVLESDGGNTLTVLVYDYLEGEDAHKHVGLSDDTFEQLITKLHGILVSDAAWMPKREAHGKSV